MKTTLTQAWEARGLGGAALRVKVRYELTKRFYKENPAANRAAVHSGWELIAAAVLVYGALAYLYYAVPILTFLDFSLSRNLGIAVLVAVTFSVMALAGALVVKLAVKDILAVGSVDRYVFQHRDDEVEL